MKSEDTYLWSFTEAVYDDSKIRCNECEVFSDVTDWIEGEAYCEDCCSHAAMICPVCGYGIDHVWSENHPMEVVND